MASHGCDASARWVELHLKHGMSMRLALISLAPGTAYFEAKTITNDDLSGKRATASAFEFLKGLHPKASGFRNASTASFCCSVSTE